MKTDTNTFTQSFHDRLETFYHEMTSNKRIDELINALLGIAGDDYWSHKRRFIYANMTTQNVEYQHHVQKRIKYSCCSLIC